MSMPQGYQKHPYHRPTLGQLTRQVRTARAWSQTYLAEIIGTDKGSLSHLEQGERSLPDDQLRRLLETITDATAGAAFTRHRLAESVPGLAVVWAGLERPPSLPASAAVLPASEEQRHSSIGPSESHEQLVKGFIQQANWPAAAMHSILIAELARNRGDWPNWTRYMLSAGHNEMNLSRLALAASRFQAILNRSSHEVGKRDRAEAFVRLGWIRHKQEDYEQAERLLRAGWKLAQEQIEYDETEALVEDAQHLLGRTYLDWGETIGNTNFLSQGVHLLHDAYAAAQKRGETVSMGYSRLRQTPFLARGDSVATNRYLDESASLIEGQPTAAGHINLYRGRLLSSDNPKRAIDYLERASYGFVSPLFYPHGLSMVFRASSQIRLEIARAEDDHKTALQYALIAATLDPHAQSLATLHRAAKWTSAQLGQRPHEFPKYREELIERLLLMEGAPFAVLKRLDEQAVQRLVDEFPRVKQILLQG